MKVTLLSKSSDGLKQKFLIEGSSPAFVNALRRTIMAYVPTLAIEEVEFHKNSSALYDEMIAHRLGLIPLTTDLETYELPWECSCGGAGCPKCQLKITLDKVGPGMVYAEDLKISDPNIKPVYPKMPIVKLLENQELKFEAIAQLGIGKQHAKWSPGHVFYQGYPQIKIGGCSNPEEVKNVCPHEVFSIKNGRLTINKANLEKCDLCKACSDVCENVEVKGSEDSFIFWVESWGQLSVKEMLNEAFDYLTSLAKDLEESL